MTKPILAVDIDGVCADYHKYVLQQHPEFEKSYNEGYIQPELETLFYQMATSDTYDNLEPIQDASPFLQEISRFYEIWYVTARDLEKGKITDIWLARYKFPEPKNIVFCDDKGMACFLIQAQTLVEDQIGHALSTVDYGIKVILLDRPYNRTTSNMFDTRVLNNTLIKRAMDWTDVMFEIYFPLSNIKSTTVEVQGKFV